MLAKFSKILTLTLLLLSALGQGFSVAYAAEDIQKGTNSSSVYDMKAGFAIPSEFTDAETGIKGLETEGNAVDTIVKWTNFALGFVAVIAIAMIIMGGFYHLTSGDNDERATEGRKMITNAIIGIIIIISAYAIVNTFVGSSSDSGTSSNGSEFYEELPGFTTRTTD